MWSVDVAKVFAEALRREPDLRVVVGVPRFPDQDGPLPIPPTRLGHAQALEVIRKAGGDRIEVYDVENRRGDAVYVHAKVCIVDDVWATIGSDNFNRRPWTHDSELTAAVLDHERDLANRPTPAGWATAPGLCAQPAARAVPGAPGPQRRRGRPARPRRRGGPDRDQRRPLAAVVRRRPSGDRPPGRLRRHVIDHPPRWHRLLFSQPPTGCCSTRTGALRRTSSDGRSDRPRHVGGQATRRHGTRRLAVRRPPRSRGSDGPSGGSAVTRAPPTRRLLENAQLGRAARAARSGSRSGPGCLLGCSATSNATSSDNDPSVHC